MKRHNGRIRGFTLVEMMIALLVGSLLIMISYNVMIGQKKASDAQNDYISAQQNARIALETLEKEIRIAGLNIDDFNGQPVFIDAAPYQIIFNADLSPGIGGVPGMNINQFVNRSDGSPYVPGTFPGERIGTLNSYNNNAETIRYTMDFNDDGMVGTADRYSESGNPDDYAIYREENGWKKDIIAYGIRGRENYPNGQFPQPLFKYYGDFNDNGTVIMWGDSNNDGILSQGEIATLSPVNVALLDKIIEVEITVEAESSKMEAGFKGRNSSPGAPRRYRHVTMSSKIRPRNVGTGSMNLHACGDPPRSPGSLSAIDTPDDDGNSITLNFNASLDEEFGEEDVENYTVYRRPDGEAEWMCIGSIVPKLQSSYTFLDDERSVGGAPENGERYTYYVTAWDCRPQESNPSNTAGPVIAMPNGPSPPSIVQVFDTPCDDIDEITVVMHKSADDQGSGNTVLYYDIFRGEEEGGGTLSKMLIGRITADGSDYYQFMDNASNNMAGLPPEADNYYHYAAIAIEAGDSIPSVSSQESDGCYYSGTISSCRLKTVEDYPDDDGESLYIVWDRSPSEECTPSDVQAYGVRRKAIFDTDYIEVARIPASMSPEYAIVDDNLTTGAEYTYCIYTYDFGSEEVPSNRKSAIPLRNNEIEAPQNLACEDILCEATGAVNVTFEHAPQDVSTGGRITDYFIYRMQDYGAWMKVGSVEADGSDTYLWVDGVAENPSNPPVIGEYYYYRATSYDADGDRESAPSNEDYTMSDGEPGAPRITNGFDTPSDAGSSITVIWDRSADDGHCTNNVITYRIYRADDELGPFNLVVGELTASGQITYTFVDEQIYSNSPPVDGIGYHYLIKAVESGGKESVNSNIWGPVYSITQDPGSYIVFEDDFESDKGWQHFQIRTQDDWQRGTPQGRGDDDRGRADPDHAYSGSNVYGNDLGDSGWNGSYKANTENILVTPPGELDCFGKTTLVLQFQRWLNVEGPSYDQATIEISVNGYDGPWTRVWINPSRITDNSWVFMELDISDIADGNSDVAIRWRLKSDGDNNYAGWNIDDVSIREKGAYNP